MLRSKNEVLKKRIALRNNSIEYTLKVSSRVRHMRLAVYPGGEVIVTAPYFLVESSMEEFLRSKANWILEKLAYFKNQPHGTLLPCGRKNFLKYKEVTRNLVEERLKHFNMFYNYTWNRVSIKNTKTRWGSCSAKGNINFSYKLALIDRELADYVVVHELCHLQEMNHSKNFWALVEKMIPDHKVLRKKLRQLH